MKTYLDCLKKNGSTSTECRHLSRDYLNCRMEKCVFLSLWWMYCVDGYGAVGLWARTSGRTLVLRRRRRTDHHHPVQGVQEANQHDAFAVLLYAGLYALYTVPLLCSSLINWSSGRNSSDCPSRSSLPREFSTRDLELTFHPGRLSCLPTNIDDGWFNSK